VPDINSIRTKTSLADDLERVIAHFKSNEHQELTSWLSEKIQVKTVNAFAVSGNQ
jgi:hypothetical protein